jgi:hypothetical protein
VQGHCVGSARREFKSIPDTAAAIAPLAAVFSAAHIVVRSATPSPSAGTPSSSNFLRAGDAAVNDGPARADTRFTDIRARPPFAVGNLRHVPTPGFQFADLSVAM